MKIRNGFVSNSSSSSFCIYGANGTAEDFGIVEPKDEKEAEDFEAYEELDKKCSELGLEMYAPEGGDFYVGRGWSSIKDDETGKEFKKSVKAALKKMAGKDIACDTHEEACYG